MPRHFIIKLLITKRPKIKIKKILRPDNNDTLFIENYYFKLQISFQKPQSRSCRRKWHNIFQVLKELSAPNYISGKKYSSRMKGKSRYSQMKKN